MRKKKPPYINRLIRYHLKCLWFMLFPHEIKFNPAQENHSLSMPPPKKDK